MLQAMQASPIQTPPPLENLIGVLAGACSGRVGIQHRVVYQILEEECVIEMLRRWTHYE
jgi:toxin YoeB